MTAAIGRPLLAHATIPPPEGTSQTLSEYGDQAWQQQLKYSLKYKAPLHDELKRFCFEVQQEMEKELSPSKQDTQSVSFSVFEKQRRLKDQLNDELDEIFSKFDNENFASLDLTELDDNSDVVSCPADDTMVSTKLSKKSDGWEEVGSVFQVRDMRSELSAADAVNEFDREPFSEVLNELRSRCSLSMTELSQLHSSYPSGQRLASSSSAAPPSNSGLKLSQSSVSMCSSSYTYDAEAVKPASHNTMGCLSSRSNSRHSSLHHHMAVRSGSMPVINAAASQASSRPTLAQLQWNVLRSRVTNPRCINASAFRTEPLPDFYQIKLASTFPSGQPSHSVPSELAQSRPLISLRQNTKDEKPASGREGSKRNQPGLTSTTRRPRFQSPQLTRQEYMELQPAVRRTAADDEGCSSDRWPYCRAAMWNRACIKERKKLFEPRVADTVSAVTSGEQQIGVECTTGVRTLAPSGSTALKKRLPTQNSSTAKPRNALSCIESSTSVTSVKQFVKQLERKFSHRQPTTALSSGDKKPSTEEPVNGIETSEKTDIYHTAVSTHNMKSESAEEAYFHSTPVSSSHPRNELCRETVTSSPQPSLVRDRSSTSSAINSDKESTSADGQSKPTRDQQPAADVCSQSPPNSPLSSTGDIRPSVAQIIHAIQGSSFSTVDDTPPGSRISSRLSAAAVLVRPNQGEASVEKPRAASHISHSGVKLDMSVSSANPPVGGALGNETILSDGEIERLFNQVTTCEHLISADKSCERLRRTLSASGKDLCQSTVEWDEKAGNQEDCARHSLIPIDKNSNHLTMITGSELAALSETCLLMEDRECSDSLSYPEIPQLPRPSEGSGSQNGARAELSSPTPDDAVRSIRSPYKYRYNISCVQRTKQLGEGESPDRSGAEEEQRVQIVCEGEGPLTTARVKSGEAVISKADADSADVVINDSHGKPKCVIKLNRSHVISCQEDGVNLITTKHAILTELCSQDDDDNNSTGALDEERVEACNGKAGRSPITQDNCVSVPAMSSSGRAANSEESYSLLGYCRSNQRIDEEAYDRVMSRVCEQLTVEDLAEAASDLGLSDLGSLGSSPPKLDIGSFGETPGEYANELGTGYDITDTGFQGLSTVDQVSPDRDVEGLHSSPSAMMSDTESNDSTELAAADDDDDGDNDVYSLTSPRVEGTPTVFGSEDAVSGGTGTPVGETILEYDPVSGVQQAMSGTGNDVSSSSLSMNSAEPMKGTADENNNLLVGSCLMP